MWEFALQNEENVSDPKFIVTPPFTPFMSKKLSIDWIEGKGQGMITTEEIKAGEVLIYEKPLLNARLGKGTAGLQMFVDYLLQPENEMVRMSMDELHSSSTVEQVFTTQNEWYQDLEPMQQKYAAKIMTNEINHFVYPKISKINHGYATNIALVPVQGDSNQMMVVATDDVPVGAEIQYDYLTPLTKPSIESQLHYHQIVLSQIEEALIQIFTDPEVEETLKSPLYHQLYANGIVAPGGNIALIQGAKRSISDKRFDLLTKCLKKLTNGHKTVIGAGCCRIIGEEFRKSGLVKCKTSRPLIK